MTTITTTETGTYQGKTAAQWRAAAAEELRRREESWERSDTDGFVTQWVHGMSASEYSLKAQLAEQNSMTEVSALFDLEGNLLHTLHGWGQFGEYFMILDEDGNKDTTQGRNGFFSPSQARSEVTKRKNNAAKGFYVGAVKVPAKVDIVASGTGLSAAATAYATILPTSKVIDPATAEVVDNGR